MALMTRQEFEARFDEFSRDKNLGETLSEIFRDWFWACNRFEKITVSAKILKLHMPMPTAYRKIAKNPQKFEMAIEFFGDDITFENLSLDPRNKKFETKEDALKAISEWILRRTSELGQPTFPTKVDFDASVALPSTTQIKAIFGHYRYVEIFDELYENGRIPFGYKRPSTPPITQSSSDHQYETLSLTGKKFAKGENGAYIPPRYRR